MSKLVLQQKSDLLAETEIATEYATLQNKSHCPLGMYVIPASDSIFSWEAVLFVHQGFYADSILKLTITFPPNYPKDGPSVTFITDIFHPLISSQDGSLNMKPRFPSWRAKQDRIIDVLHWIKVIFKKQTLDKIEENDSLNSEAFRLYHGNPSSFISLVTQASQLSQSPSTLYAKRGISAHLRDISFEESSSSAAAEMRKSLGLADWKPVNMTES